MKKTSQRSLLFRQNVNRTEAEWVHFLDGYRKALIEFDMKKFGDDWHTAEDIVEEVFLNIVRWSAGTVPSFLSAGTVPSLSPAAGFRLFCPI